MIDINKKYQTRDGREVRIYATDGGVPTRSIHGAVNCAGKWYIQSWSSDGKVRLTANDQVDLIEIRPRHKRTVWINVYSKELACITADSKEEADRNASNDRIACIKVELNFEEGEGL